MKIRAIIPVIALALLTACGSDDVTSLNQVTTTTNAAGVDLSEAEWTDLTDQTEVLIQARDNRFLPAYFIVKAGTPITFRNVGRTEHNALPVDQVSFENIEAAVFNPQDEAHVTIDQPGDYPYYCSLHGTTTKGMVGAIRVVE